MLQVVVEFVVGEGLLGGGMAVLDQISELGVLFAADTGVQRH